MEKKIQLFLLVILTNSCSSLYMPNVINTPLLQEQKEFKCTLGISDVQAAYAVTENIGVIGNIGLHKENTRADTDFSQANYQFEMGVGHFTKNRFGLQNEFYGGFGGIGMKRSNVDFVAEKKVVNDFKASGVKLFAQYNVGYASPQMDIIFSTRMVGLKFGTPTTTLNQQLLDIYQYSGIEKKMWGFLEPAITINKGFGPAKLYTQIGKSIMLSRGKINFEPNIIKFGVSLDMGSWYKFWKGRKEESLPQNKSVAPSNQMNKSTVILPSSVYRTEHSKFTGTQESSQTATRPTKLENNTPKQAYYSSASEAQKDRNTEFMKLNQAHQGALMRPSDTLPQPKNNSLANDLNKSSTGTPQRTPSYQKPPEKVLKRSFLPRNRTNKYSKNNW